MSSVLSWTTRYGPTVANPEAEKLENTASQEAREMTTAAQLSLRTYAGLQWPSVSHKGRIALLAREFGWGHRRTRAIYNGESGVSLRAGEQAEIDRRRRKKEAENVRASQAEYRALEDRIARLEALMESVHAEFYEPHVDAFRQQARGLGVVSRHAGDAPQARGAVDGPEDFWGKAGK